MGDYETFNNNDIKNGDLLKIKGLNEQNVSLGRIVAYSSASRTLAEDASLTDRDYAMFYLTQALLEAFDFEASQQLDQHFSLFLR